MHFPSLATSMTYGLMFYGKSTKLLIKVWERLHSLLQDENFITEVETSALIENQDFFANQNNVL